VTEVRTIRKLHERNPSQRPVSARVGLKGFRCSRRLEAGLLPFPRTGCVPYAGFRIAPGVR
jgi:hypothetical protein